MKAIILDREKKIKLLEALRRGYIERDEVHELFPLDMSDEELQAEIERLWKVEHEEICAFFQSCGLCDRR